MKRTPEALRIKEDFERGGKLGEKSTRRLIDFLVTLANEIDDIKAHLRHRAKQEAVLRQRARRGE